MSSPSIEKQMNEIEKSNKRKYMLESYQEEYFLFCALLSVFSLAINRRICIL